MNSLTHIWNSLSAFYEARHEPENMRPLAELYWRVLLVSALVALVGAVAALSRPASSAGSPSWCPRPWCSSRAGHSLPGWRRSCGTGGRAWTPWWRVLFLLAARFLEQMARRQASARLDTLARAQPALAWRITAAGREQVPVVALAAGDLIEVGAGEAVPADGELLASAASFDESLLTGESAPVAKAPGEALYAGSVCREAAARLRVVRTGSDTRLSQLTRAVEKAQAQRPRAARLADAVATRFVSALFVIAILVFLAWYRIEPGRAFEIALAVLVVSCPCALSLAVPAALATAHGTLARMGVLALGPDALESLARVDTVVLDKTGTLTLGRPRLIEARAMDGGDPQPWLAIAAALELGAGHPIANAFAGQAAAAASAIRTQPGQGVCGEVAGRSYRLGRAGFAGAGDDDG
ncbi:MAG: Cu2+-exporting ATPase, partial [Parcubacteria group bacterium Athens0416_74]